MFDGGGVGVWTDDVSRLFLDALKQTIATSKQRDYSMYAFIPRASFLLAPLSPRETDDGWPVDAGLWRYWQDAVDRLQATLRFRREMRLALTG